MDRSASIAREAMGISRNAAISRITLACEHLDQED